MDVYAPYKAYAQTCLHLGGLVRTDSAQTLCTAANMASMSVTLWVPSAHVLKRGLYCKAYGDVMHVYICAHTYKYKICTLSHTYSLV
jgi:hypothetical protein